MVQFLICSFLAAEVVGQWIRRKVVLDVDWLDSRFPVASHLLSSSREA